MSEVSLYRSRNARIFTRWRACCESVNFQQPSRQDQFEGFQMSDLPCQRSEYHTLATVDPEALYKN